MTQQIKLALTGVAGIAVAKFLLHKDLKTSALIGVGIIAAIALLEARNTPEGA